MVSVVIFVGLCKEGDGFFVFIILGTLKGRFGFVYLIMFLFSFESIFQWFACDFSLVWERMGCPKWGVNAGQDKSRQFQVGEVGWCDACFCWVWVTCYVVVFFPEQRIKKFSLAPPADLARGLSFSAAVWLPNPHLCGETASVLHRVTKVNIDLLVLSFTFGVQDNILVS